MRTSFNIRTIFKHYASFVLLLLLVQWVLRIYEFAVCRQVGFTYSRADFFIGLAFDLIFVFSFSTLLMPLFLPLIRISRKLADIVLIALALLLSLASYGLERYFLEVFYPLDKVFFSYSLDELILIGETGSGANVFTFVFLGIWLSAAFYFFRFFRQRKISRFAGYFFFFLMLLTTALSTPVTRNTIKKTPEEVYQKRLNKTAFFIREAISMMYEEHRLNQEKLKPELVQTFRAAYPARKFTSEKYPLLYKPDSSSALDKFFIQSESPPNLVFIIVESLTRCYSGPGAWAGSYTPFLDSLARHSLYWTDFVSTSERTIGALPGIFGSLPSAKEGFNALGGKMPLHFTLINILKKNNYTTEFFYGGKPSFDNTNVFLSRQGIDLIQSGTYYKKDGIVYWGLSDSVIYAKSLKYRAAQKNNKPFLSIYLTLSTHGPFDFEGQKETEQFLLRQWSKKLNQEQKEYLKANLSKLASYYYADRQIRNLFYGLKAQGKLDNTIFIVTGDHGVVQVCTENPIQRYHIPLLIYSPLLKKPKTMAAVNSHYNITPALLRYLRKQYQIKTPARVHWLGSDLDTTDAIQSKVPIPIMQLNRSVEEVFYGSYFLSKGKLYQADKGLKMSLVHNDSVQSELRLWLDAYIRVNRFVCDKNILVTPIEYGKWGVQYSPFGKRNIGNVQLDSTVVYVPLWSVQTDAKQGNFRVQLSFDLLSNGFAPKDYPYFVLKLTDETDSMIFYKEVEWVREWAFFEPDKKNHFDMSVETYIPGNLTDGNYKLTAYLWNRKRLRLSLKNVRVFISKEVMRNK